MLLHLDALEPDRQAASLRRLPQLGTDINEHGSANIKKLFRSLVIRVTYRRHTLALAIGSTGLPTALGVARPDPSWPRNADDPAASFIITDPLLYRRRGVQGQIVVECATHKRRPDPALVTMVVRARG